MDAELFYKLIDEISENKIAKYVSFHLMGEPLLHKDAVEFIKYCKEKGLSTNLITNISLFNDSNTASLLKYVDHLEISLQSFDQDSFEYRKSKKYTFEDYIDLTKKIIEKKYYYDSASQISITLIENSRNKVKDFNSNVDFLDSDSTLTHFFRKHWDQFFNSLSKERGLQYNKPVAFHYRKFRHEFLPGVIFNTRSVTTWGNSIGGKDNYIPAIRGKCNALHTQLGILWNGDVVPCCVDFDGNIVLGNVTEKSLMEIIDSNYYNMLKAGFKKGKLYSMHCKKCKGGTNILSWIITQVYSFIKHRDI